MGQQQSSSTISDAGGEHLNQGLEKDLQEINQSLPLFLRRLRTSNEQARQDLVDKVNDAHASRMEGLEMHHQKMMGRVYKERDGYQQVALHAEDTARRQIRTMVHKMNAAHLAHEQELRRVRASHTEMVTTARRDADEHVEAVRQAARAEKAASRVKIERLHAEAQSVRSEMAVQRSEVLETLSESRRRCARLAAKLADTKEKQDRDMVTVRSQRDTARAEATSLRRQLESTLRNQAEEAFALQREVLDLKRTLLQARLHGIKRRRVAVPTMAPGPAVGTPVIATAAGTLHGSAKVHLVVRPIMTPASDPAAVALIPSTPTDGDLVSDDDGPGFEDDSVDASSAASLTADNSDEEDDTLTGFSGGVETVHGPVRSSAGRRRRRLQCQKIRRGSMVITAEQGINFLLHMTSDRKVVLK